MKYVYCHPLFDERKCAHRFSYDLKTAFEKASLTLERFDYRGTGETEGRFEDVSLDSLRTDVKAQINGNVVCLIGIRFGATLARDYSTAHPGTINKLVLLEPIIDGAKYVNYLYRKQHIKDLMTGESANNFKENGFVNIEGYKTNTHFLDQIKNMNPAAISPICPVLIVRISNNSKIDPEIIALKKQLEHPGEKIDIENINLPVFWERIPVSDYSKLTGVILRWCRD